ncbi:MAG: thioredoxin family protein [Candidatus Micrarchaeota archaeon]|nr:thioredoxin family protein [Candidatus Micrarchaeota archaeon]
MVSPYIKAALLTIALTFLGFFFITQLDQMRADELRKNVDELVYQSEMERLLFLYSQVVENKSELCGYFSSTTQSKAARAYLLAEKIMQYEKSNVVQKDYEQIRNQYYISNAGLYLNLLLAKKYCGESPYRIVLFFYKIKENCPMCSAQGKVLDEVRKKHPELRVFAFPIDADVELLDVIIERYKIKEVPAIVIDEQLVLSGLQDEQTIEEKLQKRR